MKKALAGAVASIMILTIGGCGGTNNSQKLSYMNDVEEFTSLALSSAVEAETLSGLVYDVWDDAIRENFAANTMMYTITLKEYSWEELWDSKERQPVAPFTAEEVGTISITHREGWNDFNKALSLLFADPFTIETISEIESARETAVSMYLQIEKVPDGLEKTEEYTRGLFESLDILMELATNPSGSLNSYSEKRRDTIDEFMRYHRLLTAMISHETS